jgi:dTDP-4-amino-4,6-dideoxygalactose transaminase
MKLSGDGYYTQRVCNLLGEKFGAKRALLTTSCTSALEIATHLLDLHADDEVILPSFTFVSTANPIVLAGAAPIFAEINEKTMNIDLEDIERKITPKTRAIYPVHYGGIACPMDDIMKIAGDHDLKVVEDAAQGVNAKYDNRYLGTIGDFGCYSFHETKNYTCGEGGALLVNNDDLEMLERAEIIREKGTNRKKFFRGEVDKYTWVDIGSSYLPSDILAAILYSQLENLDNIQTSRMSVWQQYYNNLKPLESDGLFKLPYVPNYASHNAHIFYIVFNSSSIRDYMIMKLKEKGISSSFHYLPLHTSPMGKKLGYKQGDLPITERLSDGLLRLPLYAGMRDEEVDYVLAVFKNIIYYLVDKNKFNL